MLQDGCHSHRQGAGEGSGEAKPGLREHQLLQRSSIASAGERGEQGNKVSYQAICQSWRCGSEGTGVGGLAEQGSSERLIPVGLMSEGDGGKEAAGNIDIVWEVIPAKCSCCSLKGSVALHT